MPTRSCVCYPVGREEPQTCFRNVEYQIWQGRHTHRLTRLVCGKMPQKSAVQGLLATPSISRLLSSLPASSLVLPFGTVRGGGGYFFAPAVSTMPLFIFIFIPTGDSGVSCIPAQALLSDSVRLFSQDSALRGTDDPPVRYEERIAGVLKCNCIWSACQMAICSPRRT